MIISSLSHERGILDDIHKNLVAPRYFLKGANIYAEALIGSKKKVVIMKVENISTSGILLRWEKEYELPLHKNSFVRLNIVPNHIHTHELITCVGFVARKFLDLNSNKVKYGVHISHMSRNSNELWHEFVQSFRIKNNLSI